MHGGSARGGIDVRIGGSGARDAGGTGVPVVGNAETEQFPAIEMDQEIG